MSSGRGRSPCDTGPRELRLDVICPGTCLQCAVLAAPADVCCCSLLHVIDRVEAGLATGAPRLGHLCASSAWDWTARRRSQLEAPGTSAIRLRTHAWADPDRTGSGSELRSAQRRRVVPLGFIRSARWQMFGPRRAFTVISDERTCGVEGAHAAVRRGRGRRFDDGRLRAADRDRDVPDDRHRRVDPRVAAATRGADDGGAAALRHPGRGHHLTRRRASGRAR